MSPVGVREERVRVLPTHVESQEVEGIRVTSDGRSRTIFMATKENTSAPQVPVRGREGLWGWDLVLILLGGAVELSPAVLPVLFLPILATGLCWHDPGRQSPPSNEELGPGAGVCRKGSTLQVGGAHICRFSRPGP